MFRKVITYLPKYMALKSQKTDIDTHYSNNLLSYVQNVSSVIILIRPPPTHPYWFYDPNTSKYSRCHSTICFSFENSVIYS
jgi:hypothetical protein